MKKYCISKINNNYNFIPNIPVLNDYFILRLYYFYIFRERTCILHNIVINNNVYYVIFRMLHM